MALLFLPTAAWVHRHTHLSLSFTELLRSHPCAASHLPSPSPLVSFISIHLKGLPCSLQHGFLLQQHLCLLTPFHATKPLYSIHYFISMPSSCSCLSIPAITPTHGCCHSFLCSFLSIDILMSSHISPLSLLLVSSLVSF